MREIITYFESPMAAKESSIIHMDMDTFFVSVERLHNAKLIGKPVLVGGDGDRGVVASCSYEARKFGVHSAMPMKLARRLCPEAVIVRGDFDSYGKKSMEVTEIIKENVPLFEKSSIDEFYIDLSGMDQFFGARKYATELRDKIIKESGLPISFGGSVNKTVSKIATGIAKPNNTRFVDMGTEKAFLAPLSVRKIPMIGEQTYSELRNMGVETIGTLQKIPQSYLVAVFGKNGNGIWQKANGIDNSPVVPYHEQKSMSKEETFGKDTTDVKMLETVLHTMVEDLAFELRASNKLTGCVAVKIRYSDFDTHTKQLSIPLTSLDSVLLRHVKDLFYKLYERRQLIRLIGVKLSNLVHGNHQINMFQDSVEQINLMQAMDKLNSRFGKGTVTHGNTLNLKRRNKEPGDVY